MRIIPIRVLLLAVVVSGWVPATRAADDAPYTRKEEVIYGRKHGMALTLEVFTPKQAANGVGIVLVSSGGWVSPIPFVQPIMMPELAKRGYTIFVVSHGCQPKFTIPEIVEDMHRAVRYVRLHAKDYAVDPDRLGITGMSAGGHLSLMQGAGGKAGDPKAREPIDRLSSRVQAVGCFFPPSDFLNYGKPGEEAIGTGILKDFRPAFDFHQFDPKTRAFERIIDNDKRLELGRQISPVTHVTKDSAPTLIVHGDADKLVPIQQAEIFIAKLKESGVQAELVTRPGLAHGWNGMEKDMKPVADWFDMYLLKKP
jgi:acetyl esterase/lipase